MRGERPPPRAALRPEHIALLANVGIFARLDRVALSRFASYVEPLTLEAGADVVRQGDEGQELYIIARGSFGVFVCSPDGLQETRLGTLLQGDCFGEMALLTGEPRSATVRADVEGELLELDRTRLIELMRREPEITLALAASLSRRLRKADQSIVEHERALERALGAVQPTAASREEAARDGLPEATPEGDVADGEDQAERALPSVHVGGVVPAGGLGRGAHGILAARRGARLSALLAIAGAAALIAMGVQLASTSPEAAFLVLFGAAVVLWISELFPEGAVGLGLMAAWLFVGIAQPGQAASGFSSMSWLFVVAVLGIAAAVARCGLLFRAGLLLVSRMPQGLPWQAGALLLAGVVLAPVLPSNMARAALTVPLALAVVEARGLRDREPAAAALGLAAWMGSGPLMFVFLNASTVNILGWALLPDASRDRFDWMQWLAAALPLGLFVSLAALVVLFLAGCGKTAV